MSDTLIDVAVATRRRSKIGATIDPDLAAAVDAYVAAHPGTDRSAVIDEALRLWYARRQELALRAQFQAPTSPSEDAERQAWKAVRLASARRSGRR